MSRAYLVIQKVSFDHINYVTRFIHAELVRNFGPDTAFIICDEINDTTYRDGSIIFVIGEGFKPHQRQTGCTYIYLNFSIVAVMGNPLQLSKVGWSAIRRKRSLLMEKLSGFDLLLDYFTPQTRLLGQRFDKPVFSLRTAVEPDTLAPVAPLHARPYDVCFVGAMTPRRKKVIAQLQALDLKVSPHNGVVFEEVAAQSRCCVNIHAYRSNHLEIPRIIGALAAGTPTVTEPSYGLETLCPADVVQTARLGRLAKTVRDICDAPDRLLDIQSRATEWYTHVYLPESRKAWANICADVKKVAADHA